QELPDPARDGNPSQLSESPQKRSPANRIQGPHALPTMIYDARHFEGASVPLPGANSAPIIVASNAASAKDRCRPRSWSCAREAQAHTGSYMHSRSDPEVDRRKLATPTVLTPELRCAAKRPQGEPTVSYHRRNRLQQLAPGFQADNDRR